MEKIEIKYSQLPGALLKVIDFSAEDFILENDSQVLLIGYDSNSRKTVVRGVVVDPNDDTYHLYAIKYQSEEVYQKIIKAAIGKKVELRGDISSSFWSAVKYTKREMPAKLKYHLTDDVLIEVLMNPDTKRTSKYGINRGESFMVNDSPVATYKDEIFIKPE